MKHSPVEEAFAEVGRLGDGAPLAYFRFDLVEFRSETSLSGVLNHLYEDGADGFADLLEEMFAGNFLGASQALGPISNIYELQFRPSAALDGDTQVQWSHGPAAHPLRRRAPPDRHHGCAAAPSLLGQIGGVVLTERTVGYTSLDAAAMAKLGIIGECLIDERFGSGAVAQSA